MKTVISEAHFMKHPYFDRSSNWKETTVKILNHTHIRNQEVQIHYSKNYKGHLKKQAAALVWSN